uniref:Uncharacterized protein n=1 Tax=Anguilla anguilla TaxID=7936 RepID=A0A0E9PF69_ANGAN
MQLDKNRLEQNIKTANININLDFIFGIYIYYFLYMEHER